MRLIDADALFNWGKHKLSDAVKYGNKDEEHQDFSYSTLMMYEIADEVDDAPTIDAVPVVRGEWTSLTECSNEGVYCSVCHKKVWKADYATCTKKNKIRSNYCPNCGAKMESEGGT